MKKSIKEKSGKIKKINQMNKEELFDKIEKFKFLKETTSNYYKQLSKRYSIIQNNG